MSANKEQLKAKILKTIKEIGANKDGCLVFDMNSFLARWNVTHKGKFKEYGCGKLSDFLRREVGVEESDGKHWVKSIDSDTSHETEEGASARLSSYSANRVDTDSKSNVPALPRNDSVRPKSEEELHRLKVEILASIQDYLENNTKSIQRKSYLTLEQLNSAWAQRHPNEKFKMRGFGSFKSFLADKLSFTTPEGQQQHDCFKITLYDIKRKLEHLERRGSNENNRDDEKHKDDTPKQDDLLSGATKDTVCNTREGLLSSYKSSQPHIQSQPEVPADTFSKSTTTDTSVTNKGFSEEECNFVRLVTVLYKCGLEALRDLFLRIHPSWNNEPEDIKNFKKGRFRPDFHEQSKFNSGDIDKWDITLICKVLLHSKVAKQKLEKEEEFKGCEDAIKNIREIKNSMLSHNKCNSITNHDYEKSIKALQRSVVQLGFNEQMFEDSLKGADLSTGNLYYQMFLDELKSMREEQRERDTKMLKNQGEMKEDLSSVKQDLATLLETVGKKTSNQSAIRQILKSQPEWDEWLKVKRKLKHLDVENNQYILMVDRFKGVDSEHVRALASVPWKFVIDLDPDSDINGFFTKVNPGETISVVVPFTPSKLRDTNVDNMIDVKRIQWLFANGRNRESQHENDNQDDNEDREKDNIRSWKKAYKGPVQELIRACCQKLDNMKPMICIVFGIRSGVSIQIAQEILEEIDHKVTLRKFSISYLSFAPELDLMDVANATLTNLPQDLFLFGLTSLLGTPEDRYRLPSSQKNLKVKLTQMQYNFISEYLEILYDSCEEIPNELTDEEKDAFEKVHLKKFLCGKAISFPSLHYRHDAARGLTKEVYDGITEMLHNIHRPRIVQITHAPGSGGTTIARRVLWDLHKNHPCAIAKLDHAPENFGQDSEGEKYLNNVCQRIHLLEEQCDRTPAILVDGNSRRVRLLSDCIVRKLEGRAVILRCTNYVKPVEKEEDEFQSDEADKGYFHSEDECILSDRNDTYFSEDDDFKVNPKIKDDDADYKEFKMKYDKYCQMFPRNDRVGMTHTNRRDRVFHFPMMAMLDEFENLGSIVNDSLDILKNDEAVEYEIAIIIAFLQLYSNFPTPGSLVAKLFKTDSKTYREVTKHFSETLINLMVPEKAPSKQRFIASSIDDPYSDNDDADDDDEEDDDDDDCISENTTTGSSSSATGPVLQSYSFQHLEVANLVLKHSGRSLDQITQDFIQHKVLENYRKNDENRCLIDNLFLYNKESTGAHFSILMVELAKEANGGRIFEEAAKQAKDVTFFSHVARFFAYEKDDFKKARDLIKEGFDTESSVPVEKKRGVYSTEGHIVLQEMKKDKDTKITNIENLKAFSQEALVLFRKARDNPPRTYPNPLIGEVMVWQFCFEWIIKRNKGNVEKAIKFILNDSFFAGAIGECIYLLDEVDRIVETVPTLNDPGYTKMLANERRRLLAQTIGRMRSKTKRKGWQTVRIHHLCEEIVSKYKKNASEKDIIRLRVLWTLNEAGRKIHLLDRAKREDLFTWLRRLVIDFKMFIHTRDLMEAAAEQLQPPFGIDEALRIICRWQENLPNDPFSYLYQCMFCFLKVCKGSVFDYRPKYEFALENCRKKSQGNPRKHLWQYFIGKDEASVCTLITRSKLETKYDQRRRHQRDSNDTGGKEDTLDQTFWEKHCRDFLLECKGRIECTPRSSRNKRNPYILMEPGNVKVSVPRNSIGLEHMDYQSDARVSFVVYFTLNGPKAKEIHFIDSMGMKKPIQNKFNRQGSKIEK